MKLKKFTIAVIKITRKKINIKYKNKLSGKKIPNLLKELKFTNRRIKVVTICKISNRS